MKTYIIVLIVLAVLILIACTIILYNYYKPSTFENVQYNLMKEHPPIQKDAKKVHLVTFETRKLKDLVSIHNKNVQEYADFHGYKYIFNTTFKSKLPVYWWKLQIAKQMLKGKIDYFIWLDSDVLITLPRLSLDVIFAINPNASIYIAKDFGDPEKAFCAGVFIIKNDSIGRKFVSDCLNTYISRIECKIKGKMTLAGTWAGDCYEQGIMNELLATPFYKNAVATPSLFYISNGPDVNDEHMICHCFGNKSKCLQKFQRFIQSDVNLPMVLNPKPFKICILLTTYATEERKNQYIEIIKKWMSTNLPLYIVDSAGLNLLDNIDPKIKVFGFKQESFLDKKTVSELEKTSLLNIYEYYKQEFSKYDIVIKVTGKYFLPPINDFIKFIPSGTEMVIQNHRGTPFQNSEYVGFKPDLIPNILKQIDHKTCFEKVLLNNLPLYKHVRFPPIILEDPPKRSFGDTLLYL